MLDELVQEKKVFFPTKSKNDASYRSCTQDSFSFIFTGGITENEETGVRTRIPISNRVKRINSKTFREEGVLASMKIDRFGHKTIYCKGEIYTIYGHDNDDQKILTIEK